MNATRASPIRPALAWPLPALAAWLLAAAVARWAPGFGAWGWLAGCAIGAGLALLAQGRWRRLIVAGGYPLASLVAGADVPPLVWLAAGGLLLVAYPLRAWSDAPLFPTPAAALEPLGRELPLAAGASVLDAGCGLGHGLVALRRAWPAARLHGVEWSGTLAMACRARCPGAHVSRGDMWAADWGRHDVVYLFQRPESMARAWTKACSEMRPGAHLVSLEFEVPGVAPLKRLDAGAGRPLWVYRTPAAQSRGSTADKAVNPARAGSSGRGTP